MTPPLTPIPNDDLYPYEILKVYFDANQFGVMALDLGSSTQKEPVSVYLSSFRDPLQGMIAWLEQIAGGQFPAVWEIQSEVPTRPHQYLHVNALPAERVEILLTERRDLKANPPVFLHLVVRRKQLVKEFVKAFKAFLMERYRPEHWTGDLRELDFSHIKQIIDRKSP